MISKLFLSLLCVHFPEILRPSVIPSEYKSGEYKICVAGGDPEHCDCVEDRRGLVAPGGGPG